MEPNSNAINWFEIPATDIDRARKFFETIFETKMQPLPAGALKMFTFEYVPGSGKVAGAIIEHEDYKPSNDGCLLYLNANPEIEKVIDRIESAGGKIIIPKTQISPEIGYMCVFTDTEGNRLALHAQN